MQDVKGLFKGSSISQKIWAVLGFISFGLGCAGAALPILPTVPFILLAGLCFARSSARLDAWFKQTKLYATVIEGFATRRAMTLKAKLCLLLPVTIVLGISFALMSSVPVGRAVVAIVWVAHLVYFGFVVPLDRADASARAVEVDECAAVSE